MDLKNLNYKVITNEGAKCGFCNQKLKPIGFDYLYVNYDKNMIEYERCNCEKAVQFWKQFDLEQEEKQRQEEYKKIINSIYKDNYMKKRLQKYNFENVSDTYEDTFIINQLIKFTDLCIKSEMKNGLIISGNICYEKTYLAACIANKMIENNKIDIGIIKNYCNLITTTDVLVLGCTHYPLIEKHLKMCLPNVLIMNMAFPLLNSLKLSNNSTNKVNLCFSKVDKLLENNIRRILNFSYSLEEKQI